MTDAAVGVGFSFLIALTRVSAVLVTAPGLTRGVSGLTKALLAASLALCVSLANVHQSAVPDSVTRAIVVSATEAMAGIVLGFSIQFAFEAVRFAGQISTAQLGISLASMLDPISHEESTVLSALSENAALVCFVAISGPERLIQNAVTGICNAESRDAVFVLHSLRESAVLGLSLALPVISLTLLLDLIVALVARVCPQVPALSVSTSTKCVLGLWMFGQAVPFWLHSLSLLFESGLRR